MDNKKPFLRFRFIVIFAVLLLVAMFILYKLQTSLEDILDEEKKNKKTTTTTTVVTQNENAITTTVTTVDEDIVTIKTPPLS